MIDENRLSEDIIRMTTATLRVQDIHNRLTPHLVPLYNAIISRIDLLQRDWSLYCLSKEELEELQQERLPIKAQLKELIESVKALEEQVLRHRSEEQLLAEEEDELIEALRNLNSELVVMRNNARLDPDEVCATYGEIGAGIAQLLYDARYTIGFFGLVGLACYSPKSRIEILLTLGSECIKKVLDPRPQYIAMPRRFQEIEEEQ